MKVSRQDVWHYAGLITVIVLGTALRFWQLDFKPLWLDEIITALFSLGRDYNDVPLDVPFSLQALENLFTFQSGISCSQIAQTVSTESVHPPLFFCLMYRWMDWLQPDADHRIWALRAFPALMGVWAIVALYYLNRVAFSPTVGLMGAAMMAVSPFAVYLSQEARHYTLPMLLIILALAMLVQMQRDLIQPGQLRPAIWISWVVINLLGLYIHYFFMLALVAQVTPLVGWMVWQRHRISRHRWVALGLSLGLICLGYLPWVLTLLQHFNRPETDWLKRQGLSWVEWIAPLYQTLAGWVLMVIVMPVENQPWPILIPAALTMLLFAGWLTWQFNRGMRLAWQQPDYQPGIILLAGFTFCVLLQFFAIVYILNKDVTVIPRYNFVYYPGICALLAVSLAQLPGRRRKQRQSSQQQSAHPPDSRLSAPDPLDLRAIGASAVEALTLRRSVLVVLLVGMISSILVIHGFAFHKSYYPEKVAQDMLLEPAAPLMVVMSYRSLQEVALGLSFALALKEDYPATVRQPQFSFLFLDRTSGGNSRLWRRLARIPQPLQLPLNLWIIASPGMKSEDYPPYLRLSSSPLADHHDLADCFIDPQHYHRIGFPYQLYRCQS